jgi:hypothetical protein
MKREPNAGIMGSLRNLISIRQREIVPLIASRFLGGSYDVQDDLLKVTWRFQAGRLGFAACFAEQPRSIDLSRDARVVWQSPGIEADTRNVHLSPWTGISWRSGP